MVSTTVLPLAAWLASGELHAATAPVWIALVLGSLGVLLLGRCLVRSRRTHPLRLLGGGLALVAAAAVIGLWSLATTTAPTNAPAVGAATSPLEAAARVVITRRCSACHSSHPTLMQSAPWRLNFDEPGAINRLASDIYRQVVVLQVMPVGNLTRMTHAERAVIGRWYLARSQSAAMQKSPSTAK